MAALPWSESLPGDFAECAMDGIDVYAIPGFREPVSCLSHLVAVPVFGILGYFLVRRGRGSWDRTVSLAVMAFATVFVLSMSAVYHLLWPGTGRSVMRQLDISGVFALIAGTLTPVHVILFRGIKCWAPLLLVWSAAAAGIALRAVFEETLPFGVGNGVFLLMGWCGLITCILLWRRYSFAFVKPLVWGGVVYTLGAIILGLRWPVVIRGVVGAHELWHVAVLVALSLHWYFVSRFASGPPESLKVERGTSRVDETQRRANSEQQSAQITTALYKNHGHA